MRIISQGRLPDRELCIGTCDNCGTMMEGIREELIHCSGEGPNDPEYWMYECMLCDEDVKFKGTGKHRPMP